MRLSKDSVTVLKIVYLKPSKGFNESLKQITTLLLNLLKVG